MVTRNAVSTIQHYGYSCSSLQFENVSTMISSLDSGYPVFICGLTGPGQQDVGHGFVADGYKDHIITRYKYEQAIGSTGYILTDVTVIEDCHALHINWGGNGVCNGYFAFGTYDTSDAESYDTNNNNISYNFYYNLSMITNIHP